MGGVGSGGQNRKPNELKRRLGNPGKGALPDEAEIVLLPSAVETKPEPIAPLGEAGRRAFDLVFESDARLWIAGSDLGAVQRYAEAHDDLVRWRRLALASDDVDGAWRAQKRVEEIRATIRATENDLGLSPIARSRLGLAEVSIREKQERVTGGRRSEIAEF